MLLLLFLHIHVRLIPSPELLPVQSRQPIQLRRILIRIGLLIDREVKSYHLLIAPCLVFGIEAVSLHFQSLYLILYKYEFDNELSEYEFACR